MGLGRGCARWEIALARSRRAHWPRGASHLVRRWSAHGVLGGARKVTRRVGGGRGGKLAGGNVDRCTREIPLRRAGAKLALGGGKITLGVVGKALVARGRRIHLLLKVESLLLLLVERGRAIVVELGVLLLGILALGLPHAL